MNSQIHKALIKATKRSTHRRHQTGCVIVGKDGSIISDGCSHSSSFRINELHSIHAEIHALGRGRYVPMNGAIAYIATMARKSQNLTYSAPCLTCAIALRAAGIERVIYSIRSGMDDWCEELIEDILPDLKIYPRRRK